MKSEFLPRDMGPALRLESLGVNLIRSTTHRLFADALTHVRREGRWRVPVNEVLVVLKFLAAVSSWRGPARPEPSADSRHEGRLAPEMDICRACDCYLWAGEVTCPHCGADVAAAAVAHDEAKRRRHRTIAQVEVLLTAVGSEVA